jgi:hypothetical protein
MYLCFIDACVYLCMHGTCVPGESLLLICPESWPAADACGLCLCVLLRLVFVCAPSACVCVCSFVLCLCVLLRLVFVCAPSACVCVCSFVLCLCVLLRLAVWRPGARSIDFRFIYLCMGGWARACVRPCVCVCARTRTRVSGTGRVCSIQGIKGRTVWQGDWREICRPCRRTDGPYRQIGEACSRCFRSRATLVSCY